MTPKQMKTRRNNIAKDWAKSVGYAAAGLTGLIGFVVLCGYYPLIFVAVMAATAFTILVLAVHSVRHA